MKNYSMVTYKNLTFNCYFPQKQMRKAQVKLWSNYLKKLLKSIHQKVLLKVLPSSSIKSISSKIEVDLHLVGAKKISSLNYSYRKKNKVTDVLSFPVFEDLATIRSFAKNNQRLLLGDIFICLEQLKRQSKLINQSQEREFLFLSTHGFLHLLGFDHEKSQKEERKMFKLQDKVLKKVIRN